MTDRLTLPAQITHAQAGACARDLVAAVDQAGRSADEMVLDASSLGHFDSSALAVILAVRRAAQAQGRAVRLAGPPPRLQSLARLYGIDSLVL